MTSATTRLSTGTHTALWFQKRDDLMELGLVDHENVDLSTINPKQLRRAYLQQCKLKHPDAPHGDHAAFQELNEAYQRLRNGDGDYMPEEEPTAGWAVAFSELNDSVQDHHNEFLQELLEIRDSIRALGRVGIKTTQSTATAVPASATPPMSDVTASTVPPSVNPADFSSWTELYTSNSLVDTNTDNCMLAYEKSRTATAVPTMSTASPSMSDATTSAVLPSVHPVDSSSWTKLYTSNSLADTNTDNCMLAYEKSRTATSVPASAATPPTSDVTTSTVPPSVHPVDSSWSKLYTSLADTNTDNCMLAYEKSLQMHSLKAYEDTLRRRHDAAAASPAHMNLESYSLIQVSEWSSEEASLLAAEETSSERVLLKATELTNAAQDAKLAAELAALDANALAFEETLADSANAEQGTKLAAELAALDANNALACEETLIDSAKVSSKEVTRPMYRFLLY